MNNITKHDQVAALGWFSFSDQHGNVLVTAFPDDDRDEIKLHFGNDSRAVLPLAELLHDTCVANDERIVQKLAEAIYFEWEARGY